MKENAAVLIMKETDNVGVAVRKIEKGETVSDPRERVSLQAKEEIPFGFKVAVRNIEKDAIIYKYGEPIGKATQPIACGQMVHVHNIVGLRGRGDL
jgi:altronate dehydratase small subunit